MSSSELVSISNTDRILALANLPDKQHETGLYFHQLVLLNDDDQQQY
jgi:hypothetical protein